ncbi:hypothetical protein [Xanthomonas campestris]|uniref:hypothetical protein n=1 Tax=Xanthomonas campestris TaxID=339 RepID=UPI0038901C4A
MNKLPENQILVVGQRISTLLYGWRRGVVTAIHGEQSPASVGRNGPVSWGGAGAIRYCVQLRRNNAPAARIDPAWSAMDDL